MTIAKPPDILENLERLRTFKEHPEATGIFLDFDGTLSHIVDSPAKARLPEINRRHLENLAGKYGVVVVISGRAAAALERIVGIPSVTYVGNHGLEVLEGGRRTVLLPEELARKMKGLEEILSSAIRGEGVLLELKELSHAIHYRRSPEPERAREAVLGALRGLDLQGVRITEGKMLVQVRPKHPLDKGGALEIIAREKGLKRLLYVGDDTTDVDAFRAISKLVREGVLEGAKVAVYHADTPAELFDAGDFSVDGVEGVEDLLKWLGS